MQLQRLRRVLLKIHMRKLPYFGWEVNCACNHNCIFCYNYHQDQLRPDCTTEQELAAVSDFLVEQNPVSVTISGGEALLLFAELKPHILKLRKQGILVRILSNGALISREMAQFFAQQDIHLLISFPSVDREVFGLVTGQPDSYDQVIAGMDLLKDNGVVFQPNVVVTTANLATLRETAAFLWERYAPTSVMVSRATKPTNAGAEFAQLLLTNAQLEQMFDTCVAMSGEYNIRFNTCGGFALCAMNSQESYEIFGKVCGGGLHDCVVTGSGDIRVCSRDSQVYGNIFRESFEDIRERMTAWRAASIPEACKGCNKARSCRGGCHMSSTEPDRHPGSLDCHAVPDRVPVPYRRQWPKVKVGLLQRCAVQPFREVPEDGEVRLSVGINYGYFSPKLADWLRKRKTVTLLGMMKQARQSKKVMEELLRIGILAPLAKQR